MLKFKQIFICIIYILTFTGCVAYKADSNSISTPDYNQRIVVSGAHYDKVITPVGVTSIAASTIGAGYYAYTSNLIKYNSGTEQKTSPVGNAIIGAAIGFGTSYAINKILGWGTTKKVTNQNEWVYKANKKMNLISGSVSDIYVIPKNVESDFLIRVC